MRRKLELDGLVLSILNPSHGLKNNIPKLVATRIVKVDV